MNLAEFHSEAFQQFVLDHLEEDPALLLLKYQGKTAFDLKAAVHQIAARKKADKKLPSWAQDQRLIFPVSLSIEQSSSEETAKFKAGIQAGGTFLDLTGGFGVDSFFIGRKFQKAIYCERNEELAQVASHNFEILGPGKFHVFRGDGVEFLEKSQEQFDLIYADPARRGKGNQKLYKLADCEPDITANWKLMESKASKILLKVSPMLDISQAIQEIPEIQRATVLSVKNEVKEILLEWTKEAESQELSILAVDLGASEQAFGFSPEEESEAKSLFGEAEKYLIEPNAAILKAGGFKIFGERFSLKKLDANSHFYTTEEFPLDIPGRVFEIIQEISPKKAELKKQFPKGNVNVILRNYAQGANEFKKKFGLKDGGEDFLIGTKSPSGFKVFWCRPVKS
ncbi:class I SAM-dependent methyltransferase [Algoriphagus namhaensis]|uniref:Class I SAM-dependent methyltransferase n=1 Tax=Algoriphagus namhaensis TaxID=915353 RepID=A0ABV8ANC1_9BACT